MIHWTNIYNEFRCVFAMRDVLYVGGDDSNHAGDSKGEFIIATFSFLKEDSLIKKHPNRRDATKANNWLKHSERDYRFTICTGEIYKSSQNLPKILPTLIKSYVEHVEHDIAKINVYLDGRLESNEKRSMRENLLSINGIEKVIIDNFIKKETLMVELSGGIIAQN